MSKIFQSAFIGAGDATPSNAIFGGRWNLAGGTLTNYPNSFAQVAGEVVVDNAGDLGLSQSMGVGAANLSGSIATLVWDFHTQPTLSGVANFGIGATWIPGSGAGGIAASNVNGPCISLDTANNKFVGGYYSAGTFVPLASFGIGTVAVNTTYTLSLVCNDATGLRQAYIGNKLAGQWIDTVSRCAGSCFFASSASANNTGAHVANVFAYNTSNPPTLGYTYALATDPSYLYSPQNVYVDGAEAHVNSPGAYGIVEFNGSNTCILMFNPAPNSVGTSPQVAIKVDGQTLLETVYNASTGSMNVSSALASQYPGLNASGHNHVVEWRCTLIDTTQNCFNLSTGADTALHFVGAQLDLGATLIKPTAYTNTAWIYGDSTVAIFNDGDYNWRDRFGCEIGVIASSGQGYATCTGGIAIPPLFNASNPSNQTYNQLFYGVPRNLSAGVVGVIVLAEGQNDQGNPTAMGSALAAMLPSLTTASTNGVIVVDPFNSAAASSTVSSTLRSTVNASGNSKASFTSRATWINPAGTQATGVGTIDTIDTIHPTQQAWEYAIMPRMVSLVQGAFASGSSGSAIGGQILAKPSGASLVSGQYQEMLATPTGATPTTL